MRNMPLWKQSEYFALSAQRWYNKYVLVLMYTSTLKINCRTGQNLPILVFKKSNNTRSQLPSLNRNIFFLEEHASVTIYLQCTKILRTKKKKTQTPNN